MSYHGRLIISPEQFLQLSKEEQKTLRNWWKPEIYDDIHIPGSEWPINTIAYLEEDDGNEKLCEPLQDHLDRGLLTKEELKKKYPLQNNDTVIPLFSVTQLLKFLKKDPLTSRDQLYDTICDDLWKEIMKKLREDA